MCKGDIRTGMRYISIIVEYATPKFVKNNTIKITNHKTFYI